MSVSCSSTDVVENHTAEVRFRLGMEEYSNGNYLGALTHFEIIRLQFPGSSISDSARLFTGKARFERGEYLLASYEFNQLVQGGVSRELLPEAYYMFALCYYEMSPRWQLDQTYTHRAIDALQSFIESFPGHAKAARAEQMVIELVSKLAKKEFETASLYEKMENRESALIYYGIVTDRYYTTEYADDAQAAKVRILIEMKRYDEATRAIEEFLERHANSGLKTRVLRDKEELQRLRADMSSR